MTIKDLRVQLAEIEIDDNNRMSLLEFLVFHYGGASWDQGRTRVIQRSFNVSVPRARALEKASTLRDRSER